MAAKADTVIIGGGIGGAALGALLSSEGQKVILVDKNSNKMEANWFPYTRRKFQLFTDLTSHIYSPGVGAFIKAAISGLKLESYVKKSPKRD